MLVSLPFRIKENLQEKVDGFSENFTANVVPHKDSRFSGSSRGPCNMPMSVCFMFYIPFAQSTLLCESRRIYPTYFSELVYTGGCTWVWFLFDGLQTT